MNYYRTHKCNELKINDVDTDVYLSGWVNRKRDHGGLLFIDLRDHYGLTQLVFDPDSSAFDLAEKVSAETNGTYYQQNSAHSKFIHLHA